MLAQLTVQQNEASMYLRSLSRRKWYIRGHKTTTTSKRNLFLLTVVQIMSSPYQTKTKKLRNKVNCCHRDNMVLRTASGADEYTNRERSEIQLSVLQRKLNIFAGKGLFGLGITPGRII